MNRIYVTGHNNPDVDSFVSGNVFCAYLASKGKQASYIYGGKVNKEVLFVSQYFWVPLPTLPTQIEEDAKVYLVDCNECSQMISLIEGREIAGIVDHHKIGNLSSKEPIFVRIEKVGATATLVAKMCFEKGIELSQAQSGLLLAGILSDTLHFRSPTTCEEDKEVAQKLNERAKIADLAAFSRQMFDAKSDLGDMPAEDIVQLDYKVFGLAGKKCGITTIETTNPSYAKGRKEEIVAALARMKKAQDLDFGMVSVVDILSETNETFFADEADASILEGAFGAKAKNNEIHLGRRLSRKKEIVPQVEAYLQNES